eukprot:GHVR01171869.1.p1 GENE.GHVR01171869.1~~GHVR01171869.1.p1  ORF type:complete len:120 (-),score=20.28 GHVR01171869.1:191-550(-)
MLPVPVRLLSHQRGWLAPVYNNDVLWMLAVDTGAAMTMIGEEVYRQYFPKTQLDECEDNGMFSTANGDTMVATWQFRASVQTGPVMIRGIKVTVANVVGDGLLGMDYLTAADAWVGTRE